MIRQLKDQLKKISLLKYIVTKFKRKILGNIDDNSFKYFKYPWDVEFSKRIKKLEISKKEGKTNIIYIHDKPDPLTFRYRGYNMAQTLDKTGRFSGHYFFEYELEELVKHTELIDHIIFIRIGWSPEAMDLIDQLQTENKKIGFESDDYIFDIDAVPELIKQLNVKKDDQGFYFYYVGRLHNLARYADFFTTTNKYLAEKIKRHYGKPVYIIPNYLNDEQIVKSEKINTTLTLDEKISKQKDNFTIGYFSGTKTHDRDLSMIASGLAKILIEYPHVNMLIVGHLELPEELIPFKDRIKRNGLVDYLSLMDLIASVDVNIAPLVINDFTNCKSELKYFDAGIVYVPTVASPTYTFKQAIKDGDNGLLADEDKWYEKLRKLIEDASLYKSIAIKSHGHSIDNYYGEKINLNVEKLWQKLS